MAASNKAPSGSVEWLVSILLLPLKRNLLPVGLIVFALVLFPLSKAYGLSLGITVSHWFSTSPQDFTPYMRTIAITIIGSGVFGVILKSAQFSEIFQRQVANVFYNPEYSGDMKEMRRRWSILTRGMLRATLPETYSSAAKAIREAFFTEELEYHLQDMEYKFDIKIQGETAIIHQTTTFYIVASPHVKAPVLYQRLRVGKSAELISIRVNGNFLPIGDFFYEDPDDESLYHFKFPMEQHLERDKTSNERRLHFERIYQVEQNIRTEPYILLNLTRYCKKGRVTARVNSGELFFKPTGFRKPDRIEPSVDAHSGWRTWELKSDSRDDKGAQDDGLLLPGQGAILILIPG